MRWAGADLNVGFVRKHVTHFLKLTRATRFLLGCTPFHMLFAQIGSESARIPISGRNLQSGLKI